MRWIRHCLRAPESVADGSSLFAPALWCSRGLAALLCVDSSGRQSFESSSRCSFGLADTEVFFSLASEATFGGVLWTNDHVLPSLWHSHWWQSAPWRTAGSEHRSRAEQLAAPKCPVSLVPRRGLGYPLLCAELRQHGSTRCKIFSESPRLITWSAGASNTRRDAASESLSSLRQNLWCNDTRPRQCPCSSPRHLRRSRKCVQWLRTQRNTHKCYTYFWEWRPGGKKQLIQPFFTCRSKSKMDKFRKQAKDTTLGCEAWA